MKNIIALTACLKRCSIAVSFCDQIFVVNEECDATTHLVALLQKLLRENYVDIGAIEGVITASGPGSFTGIRTAQSLAKAIALTRKIPSAAVDYFTIIENIAKSEGELPANRLIVIKSEKNEAYFKRIFANKPAIIGVSSYKNIAADAHIGESALPSEKIALIGDVIPEISCYIGEQVLCSTTISNFRDARHLLNFSDSITDETTISPLYINASSSR